MTKGHGVPCPCFPGIGWEVVGAAGRRPYTRSSKGTGSNELGDAPYGLKDARRYDKGFMKFSGSSNEGRAGKKMGKLDRWSSLFWLAIAIAVCIRSYLLGLGSLHNPGPGFLFFWCGVILAGLSLLVLWPALKGPKEENEDKIFRNVNWWKIAAVVLGLTVYGMIFEWAGFLVSTALFIGFLLLSIEAKKWYVVVSIALASSGLTYLLFEIILQTRLPRGFLGI